MRKRPRSALSRLLTHIYYTQSKWLVRNTVIGQLLRLPAFCHACEPPSSLEYVTRKGTPGNE
jgi:hypothetical protein